MSFTDEYLEEKKKKKKTTAAKTGHSFTDNYLSEREKSQALQEDIAPVRTAPVKTTTKKDEDEERTWFKSGAFDDGYQFGDITKTILGTVGDAGIGVAKGIGYLGEGVGDLINYADASISEKFGNQQRADYIRKRTQESVTDIILGGLEKKVDRFSVLGDKADSVTQGIGQVGAIIATGGIGGAAGLGAVGTTGLTMGLMGASSAGSGMSEAYMSGATDKEAATYGLIKGVVDAGSEMIFGGLGKTVKALGISKGLYSLDDVFAQKLANRITNNVAKNFVEFGVKASAEGVEEVLAGIGSAVGKKLTYMDDKELNALIQDENLMEQFVVGAVTSGIAQSGLVPGMKGGSLKEANETGRDFISGMSQNEQKVVDKVVEDRIAEEEKSGKKLSNKDKNKIYDEVLKEMEKGGISTDTIEEVLGGDTYKSYKDTIDSEDALAKEYEELGKKQNATLAEQTRYNELHEQMKNKDDSKRNQLKSKLSEEVFGMVKGDRLAESYNERARKGQAFEADLTKYDAKQQETIKKAVESGILNNTRRTHEFVDMVAKITADKGVLFDFTNNEKLKESGFAVDGKTVNGYVTKDGITLNIQSAKSLNSVVGHEITHVLEGTELYTALQSAVVEYAKTKGDYQGRYDSLSALYKDIKDADIDGELTADLVGDYLFTDSDFINNLHTNNRNVFQKIYDEIKYLCKVATAGSKEARELEKVKRAFEKAYRDTSTNAELKPTEAQQTEEVAESNDKYGVIENLLSMDRVNNTFANEIIRDAELSQAFTDITGVTLEGTTEQKRNTIRNTVREHQMRSVENEATAKAVAKQANAEQAMRDGGYTSYIRGIFAKGANVADAKEILRNPEMKAEWESITGKTLPTNEKSAIKMIVQTERNPANIGLPDIDAKYSLNDADGNGARFNGKPFWSGSVSLVDGIIEEVHSYKEAEAADFHHSMYFSQPQIEKMASGENGFFFVDGGNIYGEWRDTLPRDILNKIESQITKYSISDSDYQDAVNRGDTDMAQKMVEQAAREAGYNSPKLYHGTQQFGFTKIDVSKSDDGISFFATPNPNVARTYSGTTGDRRVSQEYDYDEIDNVIEESLNNVRDSAEDLFYAIEREFPYSLDYSDTREFFEDYAERVAEGRINYEEADQEIYEHFVEAVSEHWEESDEYQEFWEWQESSKEWETIEERLGKAIASIAVYESTYNKAETSGNYALYGNTNNFFEVDCKGSLWRKIKVDELDSDKLWTTRTLAEYAKEQGYKGVYFKNVVDEGDKGVRTGKPSDVYIFFEPENQIKSADPATYDDNGNVIPLSKRFNTENPDIRYSLSETDRYIAKSTKKYGDVEKAAIEHFGTTDNFRTAGYILRDGQMLDFSGAHWLDGASDSYIADWKKKNDIRQVDHEDVFEAFEISADDFPGDSRKEFINRGNIRMSPEAPGINIAGEPTAEQYQVIRNLIKSNPYNAQGFYVDIEDKSKRIDKIVYSGKVNADRVINDIKYFYQNGVVREQSSIGQFLSLSNDGEQVAPVGNYNVYGEDIALAPKTTVQTKTPVSKTNVMPPISEEIVEDTAPVAETPKRMAYEAIRPKPEKQPKLVRATPEEQATASVLVEEPKVEKKKSKAMSWIKNGILDKGMVFEDLSLKTGNRELQARWNSVRYAEGKAQRLMEKGNASVSSLKSIRETVEKSGKTKEFYEYLYHKHNADRMNLEERYEDTPNKPVFGDSVTSEVSQKAADKLEKDHPEFKQYAKEVYGYMNHLRELLVDNGVISNETAKLWSEMYPHYVPIGRVDSNGNNIDVPLDTRRTGINAPIKKATGGSSDIRPLFEVMGERTIQTYKAIAKNRFGVELKNTLGTTIENEAVGLDETIDSIEANEELLQKGKNGKNPTFTVFENGEKVTFEITDEMYDAMKPKSEAMAYTNKVLNTANNVRRGLLTEYNPAFMLTNPIKDTQDVVINSQHPAKTYANYPKAIAELLGKKGHWYQEYMENGGEQNTYFDRETHTFKEQSTLRKIVGFPLDKVSDANNFIERVPRMAEYIASRKMGRNIDVAMLDAARVTTNFAAGGDLTKLANRNGFTFLNASVQGAIQQVRNVREAKANGLKGAMLLASKIAVAGLPSILLNHLLWDDDEEYAELSDYVKQNYYIVGKYGDGKFVRIPKGRALAVIQNAFEQMENAVTGNDEVDLATFGELVINNLAPSNPLENNLLAPIAQAWSNKTWYGDDLVPTRLQDLPSVEQYDETTDSISKWLGERTPFSPYKINYVLDQYSGAVGDMLLPRLTLEAERGNNSWIAPISDKFTTDSVMKNQNVSDFYDLKDELAVNANGSKATDEDVLKYKYINSVNAEMGKLYGEKREIQNSDLPDAEKYEAVREIQKQIDSIARDSLDAYNDVNIDGVYATVGDVQYRWYEPGEDSTTEPGWKKLTADQIEKQNKVTRGLGIEASDYWSNKEEYDFAYEKPEKYAVAKSVGGYNAYSGYSKALNNIKGEDKDGDGRSDTGTRKEKVLDWVNNLDADYGTRIILFKNEYNADDTYNYDIIDYLNGRDDISYDEMVSILKELGFDVSSDGTISWD